MRPAGPTENAFAANDRTDPMNGGADAIERRLSQAANIA
jgi:hypothetical protein